METITFVSSLFKTNQLLRTILMTSILCVILLQLSDCRSHVPPGYNPENFPTPTFEKNASFCSRREPCGFYSFSLQGTKMSYRWIQSWCQCQTKQICKYKKTDMKMRLYKNFCDSDKIVEDYRENDTFYESSPRSIYKNRKLIKEHKLDVDLQKSTTSNV